MEGLYVSRSHCQQVIISIMYNTSKIYEGECCINKIFEELVNCGKSIFVITVVFNRAITLLWFGTITMEARLANDG